MKKLILPLLLAAFIVSLSFAADEKVFIKGARPLGMGGAFIAVADDENAFFYNPAGISQRRVYLLAFPLNLAARMDSETYDVVDFREKNYDDLKNFSDLYNDGKAQDLIDEINGKMAGKTANVYMALFNPAFISERIESYNQNYFNFGAGIFSYAKLDDGFLEDLPVPFSYYNYNITVAAAVPVSYRVSSLKGIGLPGSLSLGVNFKYILRYRSYDIASLVDLSEDDYKTPEFLGQGFGADFGAIYHLNDNFNLGLHVTDIFATPVKYEKRGGDDSLPDSYNSLILPEINIGFAFSPSKIFGVDFKKRFILAADLRNITDENEKLVNLPLKHLHLGCEYRFAPLAFRAGYNSGYPSVGFGIESNYVQFSYAFYGENSERYLQQQETSWRHEINLSLIIGYYNGQAVKKSVKESTPKSKKASAPKSEKKSKKKKGEAFKVQQETKSESAPEEETDPEAIPFKVTPQMRQDISRPAVITSIEVEAQNELLPANPLSVETKKPAVAKSTGTVKNTKPKTTK